MRFPLASEESTWEVVIFGQTRISIRKQLVTYVLILPRKVKLTSQLACFISGLTKTCFPMKHLNGVSTQNWLEMPRNKCMKWASWCWPPKREHLSMAMSMTMLCSTGRGFFTKWFLPSFQYNKCPTKEAKQVFPDDLECPSQAVLEKTLFFHNESTFQCKNGQSTFWGTKGTPIINPKSCESGNMISDLLLQKRVQLYKINWSFHT